MLNDDGPWRYLASLGDSHLFAAAVGRISDGPGMLFQVDEDAESTRGLVVIGGFHSMPVAGTDRHAEAMRRFLWAMASSRLLDICPIRTEAP